MSIAEPPTPTISAPSVVPKIGTTDGELLLRFSKHGCQQSFAQLVDAHGPLVWATCRQVLCHHDDVEDAFQATFLILARRAKDIRASDSAAPWLYRVAYRTSLALSRKRRAQPTEPLGDREVLDDRPDPLEHLHQQHMVAVLVEELRALPDRYQAPLVLCYLEGRSRTAVAEVLDCTVATVKGRLARGRQLLRQRLARRGVALSLAATAAAAAVTQAKTALAGSTLPAVTASAALTPIAPSGEAALSTTVSQLVTQGASAMTYASLMKPAAAIAATLLLGVATAAAVSEPAPDAAPGGTVAAAVAEGELTLDVQAAPAGGQAEEPSPVPVEIAASGPPSTVPVQPPTRFLDQWQQPPGTFPSPYRPAASDPNQLQRDVLVYRDPSQPTSVPRTGDRGLVQLQLMQKHWEAKAEGLRLKADALARQAQQDRDPMKIADAKLAEADSYQADAERIAVEDEITRRQQPTSVMVDPVSPATVAPQADGYRPPQVGWQSEWNPQPAGTESTFHELLPPASDSVPAPGSLLRLVVYRQDEGGQRLQAAFLLQMGPDGSIDIPWTPGKSIKVKDWESLEGELKELIHTYLESHSPGKIGELKVTLRPMRSTPAQPSTNEPRSDATSSDVEQLRRQVEQLRAYPITLSV